MNEQSSQLLVLFLDGELDVSKEKDLFTALSENDELRNEMRELMAIRESVQYDVEAFTPPVESAGFIFTSVGLNPTAAPGPAVRNSVIRKNVFSQIFRKAWIPVTAAVLASLATMWFMTNKYEKRIAALEKKIPVVSSFENKIVEPKTQLAQMAASQPRAAATQYVKIFGAAPQPDNSSKNTEIAVQTPVRTNNEIAENIVAPALSFSDVTVNNFDPGVLSDGRDRSVKPEIFRGASLMPSIAGREDGSNTIILRGISANSYPNTGVPTQTSSLLKNTSIGYYFRYTDNIQVGFEVGYEPFGQVFAQVNPENTFYTVWSQTPTVLWAGVGLRYEKPDLSPFLLGGVPYAGFLLGPTEQGPLGKLMAGLQYQLSGGFGMIAGIEGSLLLYQNQGRWYNTRKAGITYGITYNF